MSREISVNEQSFDSCSENSDRNRQMKCVIFLYEDLFLSMIFPCFKASTSNCRCRRFGAQRGFLRFVKFDIEKVHWKFI